MVSMIANTAAMPSNLPAKSSLAYRRHSGCFNRSANRPSLSLNDNLSPRGNNCPVGAFPNSLITQSPNQKDGMHAKPSPCAFTQNAHYEGEREIRQARWAVTRSLRKSCPQAADSGSERTARGGHRDNSLWLRLEKGHRRRSAGKLDQMIRRFDAEIPRFTREVVGIRSRGNGDARRVLG